MHAEAPFEQDLIEKAAWSAPGVSAVDDRTLVAS
jgi:hypothetical protein